MLTSCLQAQCRLDDIALYMLPEMSRSIDRSHIRERTRLSGSSSMLVVASASRLEIPSLIVKSSSSYSARLRVKLARLSSLVIEMEATQGIFA